MISETSGSRTNGSSGPESQDAVADLPDDEELLLRRERSLLLVEQLAQTLVDQTFELVVRERGVVQAGTEDLDQAFLHPETDVGDTVPL